MRHVGYDSAMRHRWKKIGPQELRDDTGALCIIRSCKKCVQCGLMKGNLQSIRFYQDLVYFKGNEILSKGKLPYQCTPQVRQLNEMFIEEDEFRI